MNRTHTGSGPLLVRVLVFPGVRPLDVSGPVEVFMSANDFGGHYRLSMVSVDGQGVTTSAGTRLAVDAAAGDARGTSDVLLVPGGPGFERMAKDDALLDAVRALDVLSRRTVSVCTGAFLLAAAGLLDGHRATTHWRHAGELALRYPAVRVEPDAIFVRDGRMMTSAGVSAGIDLALALLEEDCGAGVAREVARDLVVFMQRPGGQSQFSVRARVPHARHEMLRRVLDAVAADPGADHTLAAMARRAGVSSRHVSRMFGEEVGMTPARYVEQVRLEAARVMLESGDDPLSVVARRSGFGSPESLRRAFVRHLHVTPGAFRARFHTTGIGPGGDAVVPGAPLHAAAAPARRTVRAGATATLTASARN